MIHNTCGAHSVGSIKNTQSVSVVGEMACLSIELVCLFYVVTGTKETGGRGFESKARTRSVRTEAG